MRKLYNSSTTKAELQNIIDILQKELESQDEQIAALRKCRTASIKEDPDFFFNVVNAATKETSPVEEHPFDEQVEYSDEELFMTQLEEKRREALAALADTDPDERKYRAEKERRLHSQKKAAGVYEERVEKPSLWERLRRAWDNHRTRMAEAPEYDDDEEEYIYLPRQAG